MSGYNAHITDTTTGETRVVFRDWEWDDGADFWWSEGNFGCDCNRGNEYHDGGENPCGDGRYTVRCVSIDGVTLYEDAKQKQTNGMDH